MRFSSFLSILLVLGLLSGCARDLILDFGKGDSVRMVGAADNFYCDDPKYANVEMVPTTTLSFADGTTRELCRLRESTPK